MVICFLFQFVLQIFDVYLNHLPLLDKMEVVDVIGSELSILSHTVSNVSMSYLKYLKLTQLKFVI